MQTIRLITARLQRLVASNRLVMCLFIAVLTLWRYWVSYDSSLKVPQQGESFALARSLAYTGQFANPFGAMQTGPSAHLAPLFPAYLAALIRVFGDGPWGFYAYQISAVMAVSILVAMFPLAGQCLRIGFSTGVIAALAWLAAKPPLFSAWECTYGAVLALIATCLFRKLFETSSQFDGRASISLGIIAGLLGFVLPTAFPVILVWLLWVTWTRGPRACCRQYLPLLILPVLLISPWIARNYLVFHRIVPVRDNLGLELAVSNNDCASYSFDVNVETGCFGRHHPNVNVEVARQVRATGEAAYNSIQLHRTIGWISSHRRQFLRLSLQRATAFWLPNDSGSPLHDIIVPGRRMLRLIEYGMTLLGFIGLYILIREDRMSGVMCAPWLALFPITYYFVQYDERYRIPMLWVTFLLGSLPMSKAIQHLAGGWLFKRTANRFDSEVKLAA